MGLGLGGAYLSSPPGSSGLTSPVTTDPLVFTGALDFQGQTTALTQAAGNSTTRLATTAFVTTAANLKADRATPTFTGNPLAPTQAAGNSTTRLATTAFVQAAASAPISPITTDPLTFSGAVTFSKDITLTDGKKVAWPAPSGANTNVLSLGDVGGTPYVGMSRIVSKPMQIFDYQGIELRGARATGGVPTPSAADIAGTAVINTVAATKALVVKGAASQSAVPFDVTDSANASLFSVSAAGLATASGVTLTNATATAKATYTNSSGTYSLGAEFSSVNRFLLSQQAAAPPVLSVGSTTSASALGAFFEFFGRGAAAATDSESLRFILNNAFSVSGTNDAVIDTNATGAGTARAITFKPGGTQALSLGTGGKVGFYSTAPVSLQTGVAVTAAGVHAALVTLGLITA